MNKLSRLQITLIFAAVLTLGAGLAAALMTRSGGSAEAQDAGQWQSVSAQSQSLELLSSGKLLPARMIEISSPVAGSLAALGITFGDSVNRGQVLGRIDSPELAAQLRTAQAAQLRSQLQDGSVLSGEEPSDVLNAKRRVLTAQTALKTAQTRQQESSALYSKGFVSRNDDEAAKTEVLNAEQQVTLAKEELKAAARKYAPDQLQALKLEAANKQAELAQMHERQRQLTLTSPLAGVVLYPQTQDSRNDQPPRELTVGSRVAAGEALMAIGDTSSFLIRAYCTEAEYAWLEVGAEVQITSGALPEHSFSAKVSKVLGQARSRRGGGFGEDAAYEFQVVFAAPQLPEAQLRKLRVGSSVKLKVSQQSSAPQTSIPLAAVQWAPDGAAQVRWRASAVDAPMIKPIRIVRSGQGDVLVRDALAGEVWVPGAKQNKAPETASSFKRMFGLEE
jgi:HlyD family secretion protein